MQCKSIELKEERTGGALKEVIPRNIRVKPNAALYRLRPTI